MDKYEKEFAEKGKDLENGPVANRVTTDIICCLLFIVFLVGMGGVFGYGIMYGKPSNITIGWDSDKNGCGYSDATADYPYLYFVKAPSTTEFQDMISGDVVAIRDATIKMLESGTCVKECPTVSSVVDCYPTTAMQANGSGCTGCECELIEEAGADAIPFRYATSAFPPGSGNGFCLPEVSADTNEAVVSVVNSLKDRFERSDSGSMIQSWISDIMVAWPAIAISSVTALILGYLYLFVIRCIGGVIIWVSIAVIILSLLAAGGYTWFYRDQKYTPEESVYNYLTYTAYGLWGLCGIIFLLVCCCWSAIQIGIAVFETTAKYVQENLRIFALPIISYIAIGIWTIFWIVGAVFVFSIGTPEPRDDGFKFATEVKWTDQNRYIMFYDIFGLFWVTAFLIGVTQFIIACSACIWYFECSTDSKGAGTVGRAFYWSYRYHLGSVAFGSFIIAVCQMMRFLFEYYRKKIGVAEKTKFVKALLCLTSYLLYLMDKCVKFISKNAYI